jgi:hypothetical protein
MLPDYVKIGCELELQLPKEVSNVAILIMQSIGGSPAMFKWQ